MKGCLVPKVLNKYKDGVPSGAVYIGRGSKWGNRFIIGVDGTRDEVIAKFEADIPEDLRGDAQIELRGKDLVCFCAPAACHGDILLRIANGL